MSDESLLTRLVEVAEDKPDAVEQFLIVQESLENPATVVRLRAGFILCREYMARFVEQGGDKAIADSIRANWIPAFGDDPGTPRRFQFEELVNETDEGWETLPVDASKEAMCEAAMVMFALGMRVDGEDASALEAGTGETRSGSTGEASDIATGKAGDAQTLDPQS